MFNTQSGDCFFADIFGAERPISPQSIFTAYVHSTHSTSEVFEIFRRYHSPLYRFYHVVYTVVPV